VPHVAFNLNFAVNIWVTPGAHHMRALRGFESWKGIPMKLTMTFDYPDSALKLAGKLEACIRSSVCEFNRGNANESVSVYRVRVFTDARFRELLEKAYGGASA
jgi:hypothetical protein